MNDVKVVISQQKAAGKIGFGIPLLFAGMETEAKAYTECRTLEEVKAVFPEESAVYQAALLLLMQAEAPAKIAVCGSVDKATTALEAVWDREWRQLVVTSLGTEGEDTLQALSDYVEAKGDKVLFASAASVSGLTGLSKNDRTCVMVYGGETAHPEAALAGATAGLAAGSVTYKNLVLKGVAPEPLTDVQIEAIHAAGGIAFVTKAGDHVTTEGKALSGEYLDILDSKDWIVKNIEYQAQKRLNQSKKVPYTDVGIAQLENVVTNVLMEAYRNGMIAETEDGLPAFSTSFAARTETSVEDRASRIYRGGTFTFTVAGAVHEATITGELVL